MAVGWHFPEIGFGLEQGFGDPGIAHFHSDPINSLVRETLQNSLDARAGSGPVAVTFRLHRRITIDQIPGWPQLAEAAAGSVAYIAKQTRGLTTILSDAEKLREAIETANQCAFVDILEVSDEETKGLLGAWGGDGEENTFHRLLYQVGVTKSRGEVGGLWGIGKHAPFAASRLRSVFYSTHIGPPHVRVAVIGKTLLTAHENGGRRFQGTGFFGDRSDGAEKVLPISTMDPGCGFFHRTTVGTSIFVLMPFFDDEGGISWSEQIALATIRSYYAAIHRGDLIVRIVAGSNPVPSDLMARKELVAGTLLEETKAIVAGRGPSSDKDLQILGDHIKSLDDEYLVAAEVVQGFGSFRLHAVQRAPETGASTFVHFMRRPRQKVGEWKMNINVPVSAVFIVDDEEGNRRYARLEPATHDVWEDKAVPRAGLAAKARRWAREALVQKFAPPPFQGDAQDFGRGLMRNATLEPQAVRPNFASMVVTTLPAPTNHAPKPVHDGEAAPTTPIYEPDPINGRVPGIHDPAAPGEGTQVTQPARRPRGARVSPALPRAERGSETGGGRRPDGVRKTGTAPELLLRKTAAVDEVATARLTLDRLSRVGKSAAGASYRLQGKVDGATDSQLILDVVDQDGAVVAPLRIDSIVVVGGAGVTASLVRLPPGSRTTVSSIEKGETTGDFRIHPKGVEVIQLRTTDSGRFTLQINSAESQWYALQVSPCG